MTGTIPAKIARLSLNLLAHPTYSSRFLRHNFFNPQTPLTLELPWFSYAAIDFLQNFVQPQMMVAEYGSGGSTIFFARRARQVWAIEDNPDWYQRVCQTLEQHKLSNVVLKLHPFDFKNIEGFEKSAYLNALPEHPLDIISIDSSEEWDKVRPTCFRLAEQRIKPGGIIIVDDSWRYPELRASNRALRHQVFQSVGPGRPGVTSTDIFFY